jgi:hypothetical protein
MLIPEAQWVAAEISRRAPDGAAFVLVSAVVAGLLGDLVLEKMRAEISPEVNRHDALDALERAIAAQVRLANGGRDQ